ncbi:tRNA (guanosine(46)-N7)-methyltransferase TrmB [Peptacetobacter hominis]|uniref:tRNA (guanine-N(7)-)-methyltransferase n=1 Tax=Peptacetobacter hominis TaxID=2743610 RepID=A0A544QVQ6_9FIRM|nr:tRNA (guanosine(46)-N7)-methyltransferase TrmB [Peptacetobacter hominis]TQQ84771.1 tRNA (guanosine(46)-N7)-methyltransferase TrmB [Peptacetobacter hominis]
MRRRKKKGADLKLLSYTDYVFRDNIEAMSGKWHEKFKNDNPIYIEVGTGKGQFITTLAKNNPNINFIAMEIKEEVLLHAVRKAVENNLTNIFFIWGDVQKLTDYFAEGELSRIYINFCDPWPKNRWAKRRLTHSGFLERYRKCLDSNGEIHFKTDNEKLFEFSLNEISQNGWMLKNISLNLAESDFEGNVTTEYEDKFMSMGMKIYRLEAKSIR